MAMRKRSTRSSRWILSLSGFRVQQNHSQKSAPLCNCFPKHNLFLSTPTALEDSSTTGEEMEPSEAVPNKGLLLSRLFALFSKKSVSERVYGDEGASEKTSLFLKRHRYALRVLVLLLIERRRSKRSQVSNSAALKLSIIVLASTPYLRETVERMKTFLGSTDNVNRQRLYTFLCRLAESSLEGASLLFQLNLLLGVYPLSGRSSRLALPFLSGPVTLTSRNLLVPTMITFLVGECFRKVCIIWSEQRKDKEETLLSSQRGGQLKSSPVRVESDADIRWKALMTMDPSLVTRLAQNALCFTSLVSSRTDTRGKEEFRERRPCIPDEYAVPAVVVAKVSRGDSRKTEQFTHFQNNDNIELLTKASEPAKTKRKGTKDTPSLEDASEFSGTGSAGATDVTTEATEPGHCKAIRLDEQEKHEDSDALSAARTLSTKLRPRFAKNSGSPDMAVTENRDRVGHQECEPKCLAEENVRPTPLPEFLDMSLLFLWTVFVKIPLQLLFVAVVWLSIVCCAFFIIWPVIADDQGTGKTGGLLNPSMYNRPGIL